MVTIEYNTIKLTVKIIIDQMHTSELYFLHLPLNLKKTIVYYHELNTWLLFLMVLKIGYAQCQNEMFYKHPH